MLFTDKMTVYNHYTDETGDHWQRSVVEGVQWRHSKKSTKLSSGMTTTENVESITIDMSKCSCPTYVIPMTFNASDDKTGLWTLSTDGSDVLVYGECTTEITEARQLKNLRTANQYVGTVREVSDNRNRTYLQHIKVVCK